MGYLPNPQHAQITEVTIRNSLLTLFILNNASKAYLDSATAYHWIVPRHMITEAYELLLGSVLVNAWLHECWIWKHQNRSGPVAYLEAINTAKKTIERLLTNNPDVTIFYCKTPL